MSIKLPDYTNSILNVSNSFLKYYSIDTPYPSHPHLDSYLTEDINHIIYVLLDGLGSNIVTNILQDDDALKKYMKTEITSVFPPTTVAATNAVLSAKPPIQTGYLGWVQYFEKEDTDLIVFLNKDFYTDKSFDVSLRDKYLKYDSIVDQINASTDTSAKIIFPQQIGGVSKSFAHGIEQALLFTHNQDKSFTYLYWTEPDTTEHKTGIDSDTTKDLLKQLNKDFTTLIENVTDDTLVVVIADHGLTDVVEENISKHKDITDCLIRKPSIEPRAINFFVKGECLESFPSTFNKHFKDTYKLYTKQEFLESNLLGQGDPHPLVDSFLGDFIGIAVKNVMISINDSKIYKAHHAGLTCDEMMVPLIIYKKEKE
jgi:hypothetical protein